MTDAAKYAAVFRAAADGLSHMEFPEGGGFATSYPTAEERLMAKAFSGIATVFEKIAEAERAP